ncbi:MAG: GNAT family N-acetyltransferase [Actinomycetota bacterium]|nr:GNAT family N-acetyltransferase [Actinomycetota bacterium]
MHVIRVTSTDVPQAAELFAAYREFYGEPFDPELAADWLTQRLEREESVILLAIDGDTAVGFTQIYPSFSSTRLAPIWILNDLFVSEEARGGGAVDALLNTAAALGKEAGAISIELATAHTNHRAQSVYDRHGYHVDEHYKHYEKPLP